jgi:hypothetical protein
MILIGGQLATLSNNKLLEDLKGLKSVDRPSRQPPDPTGIFVKDSSHQTL